MNITSWWRLDVGHILSNKSGFVKVKILKLYKWSCSMFDIKSEKKELVVFKNFFEVTILKLWH